MSDSPTASSPSDSAKKLKCKVVTIGDGAVGKTCMLHCYAHQGEFLAAKQKYIPTVFENYVADLPITNNATGAIETVQLSLWDTAGQDEFKALRKMCYGGNPTGISSAPDSTAGANPISPMSTISTASDVVSVFLVCFAIDNPQSFTNVELKWYHELKTLELEMKRTTGLSATAPRPFTVILVGTKSDSRESGGRCVSVADAKSLCRQMKADMYLECSALKNEGVQEVVSSAVFTWYQQVHEVLRAERRKGKGKKDEGCTVL